MRNGPRRLAENWHTCSLSGSSNPDCVSSTAISAMASSSGDDVPTQLAALLGRDIARIRKTNQTPPRVSVMDVVQAITGKDAGHASEDVRSL